MLGTRKTISLWRKRRLNFLTLERALKSAASESPTDAERAAIVRKADSRRSGAARRRVRHSA